MLISNILRANIQRVIAFSATFITMFSANSLTTAESDAIEVSESETLRIVEVSTDLTPIRTRDTIKCIAIDGSEGFSPARVLSNPIKQEIKESEPEEIVTEDEVLVIEEPMEVTSEPLSGKALYESYVDEICELYQNVPPSIIKAMIERESNWNPNCSSDGGDSCGLMQIQPKWHADMMASLGVEDIFDPYGNILVGVNLFSGLLEEYPAIEWALMCYNAGPYYGTLNYRNGQISSYAASIIARAEEIEGGG